MITPNEVYAQILERIERRASREKVASSEHETQRLRFHHLGRQLGLEEAKAIVEEEFARYLEQPAEEEPEWMSEQDRIDAIADEKADRKIDEIKERG